MEFSEQERVAFAHRTNTKPASRLTWKQYVVHSRSSSHTHDFLLSGIVSVRKKLVDFIKINIGCSPSAAAAATTSLPPGFIPIRGTRGMRAMARELRDIVEFTDSHTVIAAIDSDSPLDDGNHCPMDTFVLDSGSVNDESDADLTVINPPSDAEAMLTRMLRRLDTHFFPCLTATDKNTRVTLEFLRHAFDVSIYLNSFVLAIGGRLCYVDCKNPRSRADQRRHARHRLSSSASASSPRGGDMHRRRSCDDDDDDRACAVLSLMSERSYTTPDAYHSQGAFLHVIFEIQSGTALILTADQYLDSAYDNLGMLKCALSKPPAVAAANDKAFAKYTARITDALRKIALLCDDLENTARAVTAYFDAVSVPESIENDDERREASDTTTGLACALGALSRRSMLHVSPHHARNTFTAVFEGTSGNSKTKIKTRVECPVYFVPDRYLRNDVSVQEFVKVTVHALDSVSALLDQR